MGLQSPTGLSTRACTHTHMLTWGLRVGDRPRPAPTSTPLLVTCPGPSPLPTWVAQTGGLGVGLGGGLCSREEGRVPGKGRGHRSTFS